MNPETPPIPILTIEEIEALQAMDLPTTDLEAATMKNAEEFSAEWESSDD